MADQEIISLLKIGSDDVLNYLIKARERIVFAKPAFFVKEIEALLEIKKRYEHIDIDLYMEPGDKAIRLGFGEQASLELINNNLACFNIQLAERIRMAILCVDDIALLYAPNLSFAEQEIPEKTFANGILCNEVVSKDIIKQFPVLSKEEPFSKQPHGNVVVLPGGYIPDEKINKLQDNIDSTIERLKVNPPVDPTQLHKISIYRNRYKIIRQEISGIKIENKKINLNRFYKLLPEKVDRLHSSWTIFKREDIEALQDTKSFWLELNELEKEYANDLIDAGRFGWLLDVNKKGQYIQDITKLKDEFKAFWGNEPSAEVSAEVIERFGSKDTTNNKKSLKDILDTSRLELEDYLVSLCPRNTAFIGIICKHYRHLNHNDETNDIIREFVHIFVLNELKFPGVDDIIKTINIKVDFYDISDELLQDDEFKSIIEANELAPRETSPGFEMQ